MSWQLVAGRGLRKGASWRVTERPIVIGRSANCDIVVGDPAVSRRHCLVRISGGTPMVEDLDSSNAVLVNGVPVTRRSLNMGDEIAVGPALLLVGRSDVQSHIAEPNETETPTATLREGDPIFMRDDLATSIDGASPRTVCDLAMLYQLGRALSEQKTVDSLSSTLLERIRQSFEAQRAWVQLVSAERDLSAPKPDSPKFEAVHARLSHRALTERVGFVTARRPNQGRIRDIWTIMTAPAITAGNVMAVVVAETPASIRTYDESDLAVFMSAIQVAAPYFHSVARANELRLRLDEIRDYAGKGSVIVGDSQAIDQVRELIRRVAPSHLSVFLLGETGTGKELAANMIHMCSARASGPFVTVNCAAIPPDLFESEMFGHEKGAFTGATARRRGRCEQAHGGTLFLDEIGDLVLDNQARMLRVLETKQFHPVGGDSIVEADFRIVAATNRDIHTALLSGAFRADLYHRVNGVEIHIPPLRARPTDIPVLAEHFLHLFAQDAPRPVSGFTRDAVAYLQEQMWPGNVRELRLRVQRAVHLARGPKIDVDDLRPSGSPTGVVASDAVASLEEVERQQIELALRRCNGNISAAARMLGIHRNTLHLKMRQHRLTG